VRTGTRRRTRSKNKKKSNGSCSFSSCLSILYEILGSWDAEPKNL